MGGEQGVADRAAPPPACDTEGGQEGASDDERIKKRIQSCAYGLNQEKTSPEEVFQFLTDKTRKLGVRAEVAKQLSAQKFFAARDAHPEEGDFLDKLVHQSTARELEPPKEAPESPNLDEWNNDLMAIPATALRRFAADPAWSTWANQVLKLQSELNKWAAIGIRFSLRLPNVSFTIAGAGAVEAIRLRHDRLSGGNWKDYLVREVGCLAANSNLLRARDEAFRRVNPPANVHFFDGLRHLDDNVVLPDVLIKYIKLNVGKKWHDLASPIAGDENTFSDTVNRLADVLHKHL